MGECPNCDKYKYNDSFEVVNEVVQEDKNIQKLSNGKKGKYIALTILVVICLSAIATAVTLVCLQINSQKQSNKDINIVSINETTENTTNSKASEKDTKANEETMPKTESDTIANSTTSNNKNSENSMNSQDNNSSFVQVQETTKNIKTTDYSKYVGIWKKVYPNTSGAELSLDIKDVVGSQISFVLTRISPNCAHIAGTEVITAEVDSNNEVHFEFEDSFCNKIAGYMKLNNDNIYVKNEITEYYQPYLFALYADDKLTKY